MAASLTSAFSSAGSGCQRALKLHSQPSSYGPHIYANISKSTPVSHSSISRSPTYNDDDSDSIQVEHNDSSVQREELTNKSCSCENLNNDFNEKNKDIINIPNKFIIEDNIEKNKFVSSALAEYCKIWKSKSKKFKIIFLLIIISLLLYLSMFAFGFSYLDYCPSHPNIPIWLLVEGIFGAVFVLQTCEASKHRSSVSRFFILALHIIFHILWMIAGVIITYGAFIYGSRIENSECDVLIANITPIYLILGSIIWVGVICLYCINTKDDLRLAVLTLLLITCLLTSFIFIIFIGSLFYDDCPLEPKIPIWFIIAGSTGIVLLFQMLELLFHPECFYRKLLVIINIFFHSFWLTRGAFLVQETSVAPSQGYCRPSLYLSFFPLLVYIALLLLLCIYTIRFRYKEVHDKVFILLIINMMMSKKNNATSAQSQIIIENQMMSSDNNVRKKNNSISINYNYCSQEMIHLNN